MNETKVNKQNKAEEGNQNTIKTSELLYGKITEIIKDTHSKKQLLDMADKLDTLVVTYMNILNSELTIEQFEEEDEYEEETVAIGFQAPEPEYDEEDYDDEEYDE